MPKSTAFKKASQAARRVRLKGKQKCVEEKTNETTKAKTAQHIPGIVPLTKSQMRAQATGLEPAQVRCLMKKGWPIAMFNLLALCWSLMPHKRTCDCDFVIIRGSCNRPRSIQSIPDRIHIDPVAPRSRSHGDGAQIEAKIEAKPAKRPQIEPRSA